MYTNPKIFLSYSWKDKAKADEIDNDFKDVGILMTRDIRDTKFKTNLKEYMRGVRSHDYMLMLVSDSFLKSVNCMYEVLEIFKEKNYKERILQIILNNAKIKDVSSRLDYIQFWENQEKLLNDKAKNSSLKNLGAIADDLQQIDFISNHIGEFLEFLSDELYVTFEELKRTNYKSILSFINYSNSARMDELICISSNENENKHDMVISGFAVKYNEVTEGYYTKAKIETRRKNYLKRKRPSKLCYPPKYD